MQSLVAYFKNQFSNLDNNSIEQVLSITKVIHLKKNEMFIASGEYKSIITMIISGIIRAYYYTENGQEMTPFFWAENEAVASWESIYLKQPSALNFEAIEDCELAVIDFPKFKKLTRSNSILQSVYIDIVEVIFANSLLHQQQYINEKPEQRYLLFKENNPDLEKRIAQKHMASYLGITPISMSRMKKRLSEN